MFQWDYLRYKDVQTARTTMLYNYDESSSGYTAYRSGKWKLMMNAPATVGWYDPWHTYSNSRRHYQYNTTLLFNLETDPIEQQNLVDDFPDIVETLTSELQAIIA